MLQWYEKWFKSNQNLVICNFKCVCVHLCPSLILSSVSNVSQLMGCFHPVFFCATAHNYREWIWCQIRVCCWSGPPAAGFSSAAPLSSHLQCIKAEYLLCPSACIEDFTALPDHAALWSTFLCRPMANELRYVENFFFLFLFVIFSQMLDNFSISLYLFFPFF